MANNNSLFDNANRFLSILNSPTATSTQISEANSSLEALKKSLTPATAFQFAQHVLSNTTNSLPTIHFAFHVLDACLMNSHVPWSSFPDDLRKAVRSLATSLTTSLNHSHPSLLRQKSVSLLVDLALREWPQRWPDFLDQLLQDSISPLVACHVLLDLSDRVYVFSDTIQSARRQELRHAMALSLQQMLSYLTQAIDNAVSSSSFNIVSVALDCLHSFVLWADLRALFSASVPSACVTLLSQSGDTRDAALRVLEEVVTRQFQNTRVSASATDAEAIAANNTHAVFRETLFPSILQFISQNASKILMFVPFSLIPPAGALPVLSVAFKSQQSPQQILDAIDIDDFSFCIRLMGVMAQLGATHFVPSFLFSKRLNKVVILSNEDAVCAAAYVDLLAVAAASPSLALRHAVLPFFTSVLSSLAKQGAAAYKTAGEKETKLVEFVLTAFLQAASITALNVGPNNGLTLRFQEFDDVDEAQAVAFAAVTPRYAAAVALAAKIMPKAAVEISMQRLACVLQVRPLITGNDAVSNGNDANNSNDGRTLLHRGIVVPVEGSQHGWTFTQFPSGPEYEWRGCAEGVCLFVDGISTGAVTSGDADAVNMLRTRMAEIFDVMHSSRNATDTALQSIKPAVFRVLHPLYMADDARLRTCVEDLLGMAMSAQADKEIIKPNKRKGLRRRGKVLTALSAMLRKLGNANVRNISNFWQPLTTYAATVLGEKDLRSLEKISLMEAALASVLALEKSETQSEGVERILNPVLSYLSSAEILATVSTPQSLLSFLQGNINNQGATANSVQSVEETCQAVLLLEAAMHQVVRPVTKLNAPLPLPGALSRAVAPKAAEIACSLIAALHGIYAHRAVDFGKTEEDMVGILQPSCREVAYILNLDTVENMPKGIGELVEHGGQASNSVGESSEAANIDEKGEVKPSFGEIRSAQVLRANEVPIPDERFARLRERLRDLRRAGYEIIRAALYSGAAESPAHLRMIVTAAFGTTAAAMEQQQAINGGNSGNSSRNYNAMEPWHVLMLLSRVVAPLLSFHVNAAAGGTWMEIAGNLGLIAFIRCVQEFVEGAQKGVEVFGETRVLDLTREGARHLIGRAAADCIVGMWPRDDPDEKKNELNKQYVPSPFKFAGVREAIMSLWATVCGDISDQGAARVALSSVTRGVDSAGSGDFTGFIPVIEAAFKVAVLLRGGTGGMEEGAGQAAIGGLLSVIRKWPNEFKIWILDITKGGQSKDKMKEWVSQCVAEIVQDGTTSSSGITPAKVKKHRTLLRNLVEKIGTAEGVNADSEYGKNVVHALPEKLSSVLSKQGKRGARTGRKRPDSDDIELTDSALDSLFGEGDPL